MTKKQNGTSSWKLADLWYGLGGLVLGFLISFTVTNAVQRDNAGGGTSATARQTRDLPPDHPPVPGTDAPSDTPARGTPPPLPSLEPTEGSGPKAETVFKDIQVLKGLSTADVQRTMGIITVSLGVDCNYCHIPGSFESPHPKKDMARSHFQMVKQINKDYAGGKVNCYTCHRGSPLPPGQ